MNVSIPSTSSRKNPRGQSSKDADTFYFAYGSNLHIAQMAQRCPESIFVGKATLSGYRWQINQRGVANVVECTQDTSVEGLVYRVNRKDEKTLDRSEGVSKGFYSKYLLEVTLKPHERYYDLETRRLAQIFAQQGPQQDQSVGTEPQRSGADIHKPTQDHSVGQGERPSNNSREEGPQRTKVLGYVSETYTTDGDIREEYVTRLRNAISDAVTLGVSKSFVDKYMAPSLTRLRVAPATPIPTPGNANATGHREPDKMEIDEGAQVESMSHGGESKSHHSNPLSSHRVDLQSLMNDNREHYNGSRLGLPAQMLDTMLKTALGAAGAEGNIVFIIIVEERTPSSDPPISISIDATTQDLGLASELALRSFREARNRAFGLQAKSLGRWVKSGEEDAQPGDLEWKLDNDAYLHLSAAMPESGSHVRVSVKAEPILIRS